MTLAFGCRIQEKARPSDKEHGGYGRRHTLNVEFDLFQLDLIARLFFWRTAIAGGGTKNLGSR
jgi:hypothetical protein